MSALNQEGFENLIQRVREGDEEAAFELVRAFEPEIRRDVRLRLTDRRLRRTLDSTDICQSVFSNFFVRAAMGEFEFDRPVQLLRLLSTMARNKVIDRHRYEKVRRPADGRQMVPIDDFPMELPQNDGTPSQIVEGRDLLEKIESRLTREEQEISALRRSGASWKEIASELGQSGEALRKQLARAIERVFSELGLDDEGQQRKEEK
ncbi:MAG: ECF-type sigma factor [Planctomycetota bacterium]